MDQTSGVICMMSIAVLAGVAAMSGRALAQPAQAQSQTVIELYTSQGCSSCPPADALLEKFVKRPDVVALTLPVDYWDYLGWKDTFASPKFSRRQRDYAKHRGDGRIYTPQAVVNGLAHVNGSSERDIIEAMLLTEAAVNKQRIPVKLAHDKDHVVIELGAARDGSSVKEATVWLALVQRQGEIEITRGENRGRKLRYFNIVRELTPVGMWTGKAETIRFDGKVLRQPGVDSCVVIVQNGTSGPIIGASTVAGL